MIRTLVQSEHHGKENIQPGTTTHSIARNKHLSHTNIMESSRQQRSSIQEIPSAGIRHLERLDSLWQPLSPACITVH